MGIVIPPRVDPNTGQTVHTTQSNYDDMVARYDANQSFQNSFNQGIPGLTAQYGGYGGIPLPGQPAYSMPQAQPLPGGTPMDVTRTPGPPTGNMGNTERTRDVARNLIGGLLSQMPPSRIPGAAPQAMPQQQTPFMPNGMYGRQAMQLAGTYSPNTPPGDTYPNGLLGGKGGFRPGGK